MKHIIKYLIAPIAFFFLALGVGNGQDCYELLEDPSGYNSGALNTTIEAAALELRNAFPDSLKDQFKVFDYGYYTVTNTMNSSLYADHFQDAISLADGKSDYYMLFGRESSENGLNYKIKLEIKMPLVESCLSQSDVNIKRDELEYSANVDVKGPSSFEKGILDGMGIFKHFVEDSKCCWDTITPRPESCVVIPCFVYADDLWIKLGFQNDDLETWFKSDPSLMCEVQNSINSDGGFTEMNKAIARFSLLYHKAETDPVTFRNASGPDFVGLSSESGLSEYWDYFTELSTDYETAFNKIYNFEKGDEVSFRIGSSESSSYTTVANSTFFLTDLLDEDPPEIIKAIMGLAPKNAKEWSVLGEMMYKWLFANAYKFTVIGDIEDLYDGFEQIELGNYKLGSIKIALASFGVFPIGKVGKVLKGIAKAVINFGRKFPVIAKGIEWVTQYLDGSWIIYFERGSDTPLMKNTVTKEVVPIEKIAKFVDDKIFNGRNFGRFNSGNLANHIPQLRKDLGIPSHWIEKNVDEVTNIKFVNPRNPDYDFVRITSGKMSSQYTWSQKLNVKRYNGRYFDNKGNRLPNKNNEAAHIPYEEFRFDHLKPKA